MCREGGWSPLYIASRKGHAEIVSVLLDAPNIDVNLASSVGATPLYIACERNRLDVVKLLVRARGINVNQCREGGVSPLYVASLKGFAEIVSVLLAAHPEVHLKDNKGFSALDVAIDLNHTAIVALLQAHIAQTEGAEAADKAEVGAVLGALVCKVEDKNDEDEEK
jgi:serine/threonine-protein phosphatase 6 regulatory ankyrin repeat subunit B